jgi:thymidylate synthase (FAD)
LWSGLGSKKEGQYLDGELPRILGRDEKENGGIKYMKIVEANVEFIAATPNIGQVIELGTRNCYKSEDKITEGSDERLFGQVVKQNHHDSVTEHGNITLRVVTDRTMLAQITRHRHFSYSVESQRYCNYAKDKFDNQVQFIKPFDITEGTVAYDAWKEACEHAEGYYFELLEYNTKPETARAVLPNCTKTEIVMTGNIRSWRHFFQLRTASHAQKDVQHLAYLMYMSMMANGVPEYLFSDIMN